MSKSILVPVLIAVAFLLAASATFGSEADELREKAKMAKQEAAELKKLGRSEESEKVARKAMELLEAAERAERKRPKVSPEEVERLQGHLKDLVEKERQLKESRAPERELAEIRERIAKTERELHGLRAGARGKGGPELEEQRKHEAMARLEEAGRRITHLRIAADHLREVGAHALAGQLLEQAEKIEREAREAKMHIAMEAEHRERMEQGGIPAQLEELRREVGRLREEMRELGQHVKELERGRR